MRRASHTKNARSKIATTPDTTVMVIISADVKSHVGCCLYTAHSRRQRKESGSEVGFVGAAYGAIQSR